MSRKSGAQAGEGKLESRFAALTSGLLARKGQAAPSNSPIVDAAEETEAFTLSDALIPRKGPPKESKVKTPPPVTAPPRAPAPVAAPPLMRASPQPAPQAAPAAAAAAAAAKAAVKAPAAPATAPKPAVKAAPAPPPQPITIINERSFEAGYPDNPSVEEIEAIEAGADEVVTYLDRMSAEAADDGKDHFFEDDNPPPLRDPLDDLDDAFDDPVPAALSSPAASKAAVDPVLRANINASLGVREFMRLTLGAAELRLPAEQLIAEAIEEYLDARGVESLGREEFFKKLAAASSR
jgi:hypothetical protein